MAVTTVWVAEVRDRKEPSEEVCEVIYMRVDDACAELMYMDDCQAEFGLYGGCWPYGPDLMDNEPRVGLMYRTGVEIGPEDTVAMEDFPAPSWMSRLLGQARVCREVGRMPARQTVR